MTGKTKRREKSRVGTGLLKPRRREGADRSQRATRREQTQHRENKKKKELKVEINYNKRESKRQKR